MGWKRILVGLIFLFAAAILAISVIITRYDYNKLKPQIESAFKEATGRELTLKGNLDLKIGLAPALVVNGAAVQNAPWGARPEMAEIKRLEVKLALIPLLFRRVEVKRIVLSKPDVLIETNAAGESNLPRFKGTSTGSAEKSSGRAKKVRFAIEEIDIEDGLVTYRSGETGKVYVLVVKGFRGSAGSIDSPLKVALSGAYNGRPFQIKGALMPLLSLSDGVRPWPFKLAIDIGGTTIDLSGTVRDVGKLRGLDAMVLVKSKNAATVAEFLGSSVPVHGPLSVSCRLTDAGPKAYRFAPLKAVAGDSDFEGSVLIDFGKSRPAFAADLRSEKVDLRPYAGTERTAHDRAPSREVFSDAPLPLDWLRSVDADVHLKVVQVLSSRLVFRDLDGSFNLKDGHLKVKPFTAAVAGGNVEADLDLKSGDGRVQVEVQATATRVDISALLLELKRISPIEGRVDANLKVTGTGNSLAALMSGLGGTTYALMGEGRINNRYIGLLGGTVSSDIFRMINPLHEELPTTGVNCIVCGFKIAKGIARTTAFVMSSDYMSLVGEGTVNLRTEGLDFNLRPIPKEGIGNAITGKFGLSAAELARPLKLTGTLAHPSLGIDLNQSAITIGKAVGGLMLLGPAGLGSVFLSEGSSEKQLCPLAVKAARQGVKLNLTENKGVTGKSGEEIEKGVGEIGKELRKLFGR
jgi:uncharacterized protein involved in outer membrane biogenesis